MPTERLRTQDATLWCVQPPDAPLQVGALCLFEGAPLRDREGALRIAALRRHIEGRLQPFPRLRQRLAPVPFDFGRPVWVDDPDFDIARHVRFTALPRPGDQDQLRELVARSIEEPLDPGRPLWEFWFIDGLPDDRVAVVPKVSHVMADGQAVLEFALALLDGGLHARRAPIAPSRADPTPGAGRLVVEGLVDRSRRQLRAALAATGTLARPHHLRGLLAGLVAAGASIATVAPRLPFTRPVGPRRDFAWVGLPIADLLEVKRSQAVTLNDVGLAIVAGGLRRYLERRPDRPVDLATRRPRVIVPVSTHAGRTGETENRFSMMVADLPLDPDDPLEQLQLVHTEMARRKQSAQQAIAPMLFGLGDVLPERVLRAAGPMLLRRQPFVNLAVTNLPGAASDLYLLGSRMLGVYPYVTVTGNIALIVGLLSYGAELGVGITVDADVVTDVADLANDVEEASRRLVAADRSAGRVAARSARQAVGTLPR